MTDLASRFAGTRSFIPALEEAFATFHEAIACHIRPWQAPSAPYDEVAAGASDVNEREATPKPERKVTRKGEFNGRAFSIFDDGSIEVETGSGIQRFENFAELTAAAGAGAKNGHAATDPIS